MHDLSAGQGRLYRILFRLVSPRDGRTTSAVFEEPGLEMQRSDETSRTPVTVRPAPYVVSTFGEAILQAPESCPLHPGDRIDLWVRGRKIAAAMVADVLNDTQGSS